MSEAITKETYHNKNAIVLAADYKYEQQLMTTIKSVCLHNTNIRFYLLNRDFPTEWFNLLNDKLKKINAEIIDAKVNNDQIKNYKTYTHISSDSTYFRYFIPYLKEDKVLYLDSDLVVNCSLTSLFELDINDYFIAAVEDIISSKFFPTPKPKFNAGVMLINNKKWREENISQRAIEYTSLNNHLLRDADQEVLNNLFEDNWLQLHRYSNYLVGLEYLNSKFNTNHHLEDLGDKVPFIVHYNTEAKPWNNLYSMRFRSLYWFYYNLEWSEIIKKHS